MARFFSRKWMTRSGFAMTNAAKGRSKSEEHAAEARPPIRAVQAREPDRTSGMSTVTLSSELRELYLDASAKINSSLPPPGTAALPCSNVPGWSREFANDWAANYLA